MSQLPLSLGLPVSSSLENFLAGPNAQALQAVLELSSGRGPRVLYLWGRPGTGKTHLLQAACRYAGGRDEQSAFVPLDTDEPISPALLHALELVSLIGIDDLHLVAGRADWERALFRLYNETERTGTRIMLTGVAAIGALDFGLEDLRSRLASGLAIQLQSLNDAEREAVLRERAAEHGFEIPSEVIEYLMRRHPRSMHDLMELVDKLDRSTLAAGRRVTIPFVKSLLENK